MLDQVKVKVTKLPSQAEGIPPDQQRPIFAKVELEHEAYRPSRVHGETEQFFKPYRPFPVASKYDETKQFYRPARDEDKEGFPPVAYKAHDETKQFFEPKPYRPVKAKIQDKEGIPLVQGAYQAYGEAEQFFEPKLFRPVKAKIQNKEGFPPVEAYDETKQLFEPKLYYRPVKAKIENKEGTGLEAYDETEQFFEPVRVKIQDKKGIPPEPHAFDETEQLFEPVRVKIQDKKGIPTEQHAFDETEQFFEPVRVKIQDKKNIPEPEAFDVADQAKIQDKEVNPKYIMTNYKVLPLTWIETEVSRKRQSQEDKEAQVKKARFGPYEPSAPFPPSYYDVSTKLKIVRFLC